MVTKLEEGKSYRLVDKERYFVSHHQNAGIYEDCVENGVIKLDKVDTSNNGWLGELCPITHKEAQYFELVEDGQSLTKLTLTFGELDNHTKKDLLGAWVDGDSIEYLDQYNMVYEGCPNPKWYSGDIYRVKPPVSEKDKLMAAAQQKLKEAQEELAKAQGL